MSQFRYQAHGVDYTYSATPTAPLLLVLFLLITQRSTQDISVLCVILTQMVLKYSYFNVYSYVSRVQQSYR